MSYLSLNLEIKITGRVSFCLCMFSVAGAKTLAFQESHLTIHHKLLMFCKRFDIPHMNVIKRQKTFIISAHSSRVKSNFNCRRIANYDFPFYKLLQLAFCGQKWLLSMHTVVKKFKCPIKIVLYFVLTQSETTIF